MSVLNSEESGWTSYLIDFEIMNQRERESEEMKMMNMSIISSSSSTESAGGISSHSNINNSYSNMVSESDAAGAACRRLLINKGGAGAGSNQLLLPAAPRKLNTKTKKKLASDFEDPFEDTATSPHSRHSSPKTKILRLARASGPSGKNYISNDHKTGSPLGKLASPWYFHQDQEIMRSAAAGNEGIRGEDSYVDDDDDCCIST